MSEPLPSLLWLALGGTIQAQGHDRTDRDRYWRTGHMVPADELLTRLPERLGPIRVEQVADGASHDLELARVLSLVSRLRQLDPSTTSGVVISLGSNALEEVAFLLWLFGPAPVPVVVTAAMQPPTAVGTDAYTNLAAAMTVAATPSPSANVVVVSDGAILRPAGLTKTHTMSVHSFRAGGHVLGTVNPAGKIQMDHSGSGAGPLSGSPLPHEEVPVALIASYLGSDGALVRAALAGGLRAIVSIGLGAGFPPDVERVALAQAHHAGAVVCLARRTAFGRTVDPTDTAPFLSAGALSALQARLVLAVALASDPAPGHAELQDLIDRCAP